MNLSKQSRESAIVNGSTRIIGKEIALLLLPKGWNVIISSGSQEGVNNVIEEIYLKFPSCEENIYFRLSMRLINILV